MTLHVSVTFRPLQQSERTVLTTYAHLTPAISSSSFRDLFSFVTSLHTFNESSNMTLFFHFCGNEWQVGTEVVSGELKKRWTSASSHVLGFVAMSDLRRIVKRCHFWKRSNISCGNFVLNPPVLSAGSCEEPLVDLSEVLKSDTDLLGMLSDNMGKQSEESGRPITVTLTSSYYCCSSVPPSAVFSFFARSHSICFGFCMQSVSL